MTNDSGAAASRDAARTARRLTDGTLPRTAPRRDGGDTPGPAPGAPTPPETAPGRESAAAPEAPGAGAPFRPSPRVHPWLRPGGGLAATAGRATGRPSPLDTPGPSGKSRPSDTPGPSGEAGPSDEAAGAAASGAPTPPHRPATGDPTEPAGPGSGAPGPALQAAAEAGRPAAAGGTATDAAPRTPLAGAARPVDGGSGSAAPAAPAAPSADATRPATAAGREAAPAAPGAARPPAAGVGAAPDGGAAAPGGATAVGRATDDNETGRPAVRSDAATAPVPTEGRPGSVGARDGSAPRAAAPGGTSPATTRPGGAPDGVPGGSAPALSGAGTARPAVVVDATSSSMSTGGRPGVDGARDGSAPRAAAATAPAAARPSAPGPGGAPGSGAAVPGGATAVGVVSPSTAGGRPGADGAGGVSGPGGGAPGPAAAPGAERQAVPLPGGTPGSGAAVPGGATAVGREAGPVASGAARPAGGVDSVSRPGGPGGGAPSGGREAGLAAPVGGRPGADGVGVVAEPGSGRPGGVAGGTDADRAPAAGRPVDFRRVAGVRVGSVAVPVAAVGRVPRRKNVIGAETTGSIPVHLLFRDEGPAGAPAGDDDGGPDTVAMAPPAPKKAVIPRPVKKKEPRPASSRPAPTADPALVERPAAVLPGWLGVAGGLLALAGCAAVLWWAGAVPAEAARMLRLPPRPYHGIHLGQWALLALGVLLLLFSLGGLGRGRVGYAWVLTLFGDYRGTVRRTGLVWVSPLLLRRRVDVRLRHWRSEPLPAVDAKGTALDVTVLVVWRVRDTVRAALGVDGHEDYLREQVEAAMARVLSQLPADAFHEDAPTLRDAEAVGEALTRMLSAECAPVGLDVFSAQPTRIEYAPEVAAAMRRRRIAAIDAKHRDSVLTSVVDAVDDVVHRLTSRGLVELDDYERKALVKDLTVAFYTGRGGPAESA